MCRHHCSDVSTMDLGGAPSQSMMLSALWSVTSAIKSFHRIPCLWWHTSVHLVLHCFLLWRNLDVIYLLAHPQAQRFGDIISPICYHAVFKAGAKPGHYTKESSNTWGKSSSLLRSNYPESQEYCNQFWFRVNISSLWSISQLICIYQQNLFSITLCIVGPIWSKTISILLIPQIHWKQICHHPKSQKPRRNNNHTQKSAESWSKLSHDVKYFYGHKFQRAVDYLDALAANSLWRDSDLAPLPWHQEVALARPHAEPRYLMHQAILNALAPAVPLRAVFANRGGWAPMSIWCGEGIVLKCK